MEGHFSHGPPEGYTPKIALADATFGIEIQMSIDIRGRRNIAVTQPFLDFFQADPVCIQQDSRSYDGDRGIVFFVGHTSAKISGKCCVI